MGNFFRKAKENNYARFQWLLNKLKKKQEVILISVFPDEKNVVQEQNVNRSDIWLCANPSKLISPRHTKFQATVKVCAVVRYERHVMPPYVIS